MGLGISVMGQSGFSRSQEHWLSVGTAGTRRRFGVTGGSLEHWGGYGRSEILESKVGVGGPSETVEDSESWRCILEVGGKYGDVWGWY